MACIFGLAGSASAIKWIADESYRIGALGGAVMAFEDETTAINPFNHENVAGLALLEKANRLDVGLAYSSDVITTPAIAPFPEIKTTATDTELTRPGAQYQGLVYWLDNSTVVQAGIQGLLYNSTTSATGMDDQKVNFSGLGGGAAVAYKTDFGLALGGGVSYIGAGGKPDPLPTGCTKYDTTASLLHWGAGAAYVLPAGEENKMTLGLSVGSDDDMPNVAAIGDFGDYSGTTGITMDLGGGYTMESTSTITNTPLKISGEAIFDLGKILQAGLLIDSKSRETKTKTETTSPLGSSSSDLKTASLNIFSISPIVTANLPLAEGLNLLPGVMFTTFGTGTLDGYTAIDATSSYKSSTLSNSYGTFVAGLGLQALSKQLQLGVQFSSGEGKCEEKSYDSDGNSTGSTPYPDTASMSFGGGAEYWVLPMLALRAGYKTSTDTVKGTPGNADSKSTTNRISFGAGFNLPQSLTADLLVAMDSFSQDPSSSTDDKEDKLGVYLGVKLPL